MTFVSNHVLHGDLAKHPGTIVRGDGVYVYDDNEKRYLDAIGGVGVVNIGHGVKEIVDALAEQAQKLAFSYGTHMDNQPRQALASILNVWAPAGMRETKTLFCSGGAEANEAALKLAYQYHWERGDRNKRKVIGRWQSYHGNTVGTLSMSGRTAWRRMHDPLLLNFPHIPPPYCYRCPWGRSPDECGMQCAEELRRSICQEGPENIAAFIAEPIIGTSMSAVVPPGKYYQRVREICDEFNVLFIADEVMSGVGRSGRKWGIEHWGVVPDMITTAKGIAGGYAPLAATILSEKVWRAIADGTHKVMHSHTYGGMPLSCAAGAAVLQYIEKHDLITRAGVTGGKLLAKLQARLDDLPWVGDIRGKGLFIGIEIVADKESKTPFPPELDVTHRIEDVAFNHGLLILGGAPGLIDGVGGDHFELLPPYTIEDEHIEFIVGTLHQSLEAALSGLSDRYKA
ncbi:MAG: aminotransferase class III-fold pyridoxal phosphate-dependent enzyme [Candidatus Sulfotelmatobacter sp.]